MTAAAPKPPTVAEALARARVKRKELSDKTDKLNEKIREFAKVLAGLRLGVTARVCIDSDDQVGWYRTIEFTKNNNQWTILHETGREDCEAVDTREELTDAPRSVRMLAVKHFPQLVHKLVEAISTEAEQVQQRIDDTDRLMKDLKAASVGSDIDDAEAKQQAKGSGK